MADNTKIDAGTSGDLIATDDINGVKFQRVKIALGADGVNDGDVSSDNPMPVCVESLPLPEGAATSAKQDTEIAYQSTLESLVDTLQELIQRLAPLAACVMVAGGVGLRVVNGQTITTTALTNAQYVAANLTSRLAVENQTAVLANINNCVGV